MEFQDKVLTCIDCGAEFIFTSGEQLFFHDKQFKNEPKRCKTCKSKRVAVLSAAPHSPANGAQLQPRGNTRHLLPVRQRDHRAFPPYAGPAHLLPRVLHAEEDRRDCLTRHRLSRLESRRRARLGTAGADALRT